VTAVCEALRDRLLELGAAPEKVEVILHGVDQDLFSPPADRAALRRGLGFTRPTLISVGHLIRRKGHDLAIEAIAELPATDLVIVGDGPEEKALRRLATRIGVSDRVRFLGHVDQARLPPLMGAADALVLCSDREGIANVLMEALACGTPVAATPVWGSAEVVTTADTGVLLADRSVGAIVAGVRQLLAQLPDRAATRECARRFTWAETASRHADLIRRVVRTETPRQVQAEMQLQ
jgi:glycosyltransferase involved in cell wall biosynthesis